MRRADTKADGMGEADMSTGTEENFTNEDRRQLTVRNLTIGKGIPKICVPLTGITQEEILTEAGRLEQFPADPAGMHRRRMWQPVWRR